MLAAAPYPVYPAPVNRLAEILGDRWAAKARVVDHEPLQHPISGKGHKLAQQGLYLWKLRHSYKLRTPTSLLEALGSSL
jgi:hypothetical protein